MLTGIRIVEFANYIPVPYATQRLAEMGAEVIKIEPPQGDLGRAMEMDGEANDVVFRANNRGKKSIVLDLKTAEGQQHAHKLISQADVLIESFRPGVMDRLGLGYQQVSQAHPRLIYCSLSGYGQTGARRDFGSHDLNFLALSGVLAQLKDTAGVPIQPSITLGDLIGGMTASERILAALVQRGIKGEGCYLDIAIIDAMYRVMNNHLLIARKHGIRTGIPNLAGEIVNYAIYETKDQRYVTLAALEMKFWKQFCEGVGRADWILYHMSAATEDNTIYAQIQNLFQSCTMEEWSQFGKQVDCCLTPVLEVDELPPEALTAIFGPLQDVRHRAPALGEHTDEVISKLLS
ncbi:CaiB/BaiF CoA transferase family protein [Brevibacillus dissolubilis]|uniref:CaiB/BaiF CoA transferase family protein n=1 Tax=Brevibacillus dissolubilis TaxID=1844116 RepID=UPI0011174A34|nr:CoA transferase [Brevibacillus dissolubilis]